MSFFFIARRSIYCLFRFLDIHFSVHFDSAILILIVYSTHSGQPAVIVTYLLFTRTIKSHSSPNPQTLPTNQQPQTRTAHQNTPQTHKMAFEWLAPITTPEALRSVQADSSPLITLLLVLIGLSCEGALIWYISFVTAPPVDKSKPKPKSKLLGFFGRGKK